MSTIKSVPTIVGMIRQSCEYFGIPVTILPNTTLNQKLGIFADEVLNSTDVLRTRYLAVGNGGHDFTISSRPGRKKKWKSLGHNRTHTGLFNQVPWVLRLLEDDLTPEQRLRYRLRRVETHGGLRYAAYYLRVLDLTETTVKAELRHVEDGVTTSRPYVPMLEHLSPVPDTLVTGEEVTTSGDYAAVSSLVKFHMTPEDVQEFITAVNIIEGEEGLATISEIGVCSGVDRTLSGEFIGGTQAYTEAIAVQIMNHIPAAWVMEYMTLGATLNFDAGNVEPLLTVE